MIRLLLIAITFAYGVMIGTIISTGHPWDVCVDVTKLDFNQFLKSYNRHETSLVSVQGS